MSLNVNDLIIDPENKSVKIKLRRSKTDQDSLSRLLYLGIDLQKAILEWFKASGISDRFLFKGVARGEKIKEELSPAQINRIYKRIARKSRVDQSLLSNISGHSMRVGAAQGLLRSGASLPMMMERGRWSKADTVMRYIENANF